MNLAGVIIAGGRSSRMEGVEKIFIEIGGKRILDRIVDRLAPQAGRLAINANGDIKRFESTGLAVIPDLPDDKQTPLAGLHAALHWTKANGFGWLLTVASDTPFLPRDLVAKLVTAHHEVAIAASGGQQHFLTGLWSVSLCAMLDDAIKNTHILRVQDWAKRMNAVALEWPVEPFDPFFNVNTPEDLAEAQKIAARFAP